MNFSFQQLSKPVAKAIVELGYTEPTEIQQKSIPLLMNGDMDFVGQAQTGTGKTAAFCLPLLEKINPKDKNIQAIILSPTRELANQINDEIIRFAKYLSIKTATVYGGVGYRDQIDNVRKAQVVIATPGRAIDLLEKGKFPLSKANFLIIDEADEMLKMGFIEDVETITESVSPEAQKWMFSATMPKPIVNLMQKKLDNPEIVRVQKKTLSNENVTQSYATIPKKDFVKGLKAILLNEPDFYGIIFCETREETKTLHEKLVNLGHKVVSLHGDLNQHQRDMAMKQFKERKATIAVCTDVAARGLDVSELTHVINMGLPRKKESYVHRIGRTGRAGNLGKAISFVSPGEIRGIRDIERLTKAKLAAYKFPTSAQSKKNRVHRELMKMDGLKAAMVERGDSFVIDDSFGDFYDYFKHFSKEEIIKLLFSHYLNRDLRMIDESLNHLNQKMNEKVPNTRSDRSGGRRRRPRRRQRFR